MNAHVYVSLLLSVTQLWTTLVIPYSSHVGDVIKLVVLREKL